MVKDLRRRRRDPAGLLLTLAIPLAIVGIMTLAFGGFGSSGMPKAKLAVVDLDDTLLTRFISGGFKQGPLPDLLEAIPADSAEAIALVRGDKVSAALFIPDGFTDAYLEGRTARLDLVRNPAQYILPSILEEVVATMAEGGFYIREIFSDPIAEILGLIDAPGAFPGAPTGAPPDAVVAGILTSISRVMNRSARYIFPPVIELKTDSAGEERGPGLNLVAFFLPGMIVLSLLFLGQALALDVWEEVKAGTLRRTAASPNPMGVVLNGKVLAGVAVLMLIMTVLFTLAWGVTRLPAAGMIRGYGTALAIGTVILALMHWLVLLPRSEQGANLLSTAVIMPSALIGGGFFPVEAMPQALRGIVVHTPVGWAVERVKDALMGRAPGAWEAGPVLAVCLAGTALFLIMAHLQAKRRLARGM